LLAKSEPSRMAEVLAKTTNKGDQHMKKTLRFVGLDVHKDTIVIAVADQGSAGEVRMYGTISSDWHAVERAVAKLRVDGAELRVAYEAGPTGFTLYRKLRKMHIECLVVAPSKMPVPSGRRQKTDRRDAELLARLLRAGELTAIHVPDAVDESIRDLTRARSDAVDDQRRAKQRLKSFLLRAGYHYTGKADWGEKHQRYLRQLTLPLAAHKAVLEEYLLALDQGCERVSRFDDLLAAQVPQWCHYPAVQALMARRGVQLVAATVLVAEIDDIHRFAHPRHLMAFLGLVPHEHTTGSTRRIGAITKTGNVHARWMLIETVPVGPLPAEGHGGAHAAPGRPVCRREGARLEGADAPPPPRLAPDGPRRDETQGDRRPGPRDGRLCLGDAPPGARARRTATGRSAPATSVTLPFSERPAGAASLVQPPFNPFPRSLRAPPRWRQSTTPGPPGPCTLNVGCQRMPCGVR
jgi:transposase